MRREQQILGWVVMQNMPDKSIKKLSMRFTVKSAAEQFVAVALKSGMDCYIAEDRKHDKVEGT